MMGVVQRLTPGRTGFWVVALAAALFVAWGYVAQTPAYADETARMSLSVSGPDVSCSGDVCTVGLGGTFTASINVDDAPDAGYVLVQSFLDYGTDLTYNPTDDEATEVIWPDVESAVIVRFEIGPGLVNHGGLTGIIPPLPLSTYEGTAFELQFTCSEAFSTTNLQLLPEGDDIARTNGALFTLEDAVQVIPKVNSITVNCAEDDSTPPDDLVLPDTGGEVAGAGGESISIVIWLAIGALLVAGAAGLGMFGWRAARARR